MEIVPLNEGEKSGTEALRDGERAAHFIGTLDEAPPREACVGRARRPLARGGRAAGAPRGRRRRGGRVALVEHALHRTHLAGFENVELDRRSTNLLASRFWPRRGFRPTHLRLGRDVQPPHSIKGA